MQDFVSSVESRTFQWGRRGDMTRKIVGAFDLRFREFANLPYLLDRNI